MAEEDEEEAEVEEERSGVAVAPGEGDEVESSLEELLARKSETPPGEEEDSLLDLAPDEHVESLSIRAAPKQANEFVCSNCRLVKHNSQLADKKRTLCRDCV